MNPFPLRRIARTVRPGYVFHVPLLVTLMTAAGLLTPAQGALYQDRVTQDTTIDASVAAAGVSTGYFSTSKTRSTMSTAKVDGKDLAHQPVTTLMTAVVGRMTGVDVTPVSGVAGIAPVVQIRGTNSLGIGTDPLYIVDGVQIESQPIPTYGNDLVAPGFDPLSSLDPADIESIEVLKDAAATAIYGSRGANGVIRITTRKAVAFSKTGIELSSYTGIGQVSRYLDLLNTRQYMTMRREALRNAQTPVSPFTDPDLTTWDTTRYTDFQKVLIGNTAKITDIHGSVYGGSDLTGIRLTGGYHKEGTVYPGDFGMQRMTTGLSFNHSSSDRRFKAVASMNYGWTKHKSFNGTDFMYNILTLPPVAPAMRDSLGNINFQFNNPLAYFLKTDEFVSNQIIGNATLSYEILKGLTFTNSLSLQYFAGSQVLKNPQGAYAPMPALTGNAAFGDNTRSSLMIEPQLLYERQFSGHQLSIMAGAAWQNRTLTYQVLQGSGYALDAMLDSPQDATNLSAIRYDHTEYRYVAGYARLGYNFRNRYLIDLTGRRDGSTRFTKRYGNFGAVGAAWMFSNEVAIKNTLSFLSFGKIRASYGTTGNDQIADYANSSSYSQIYPYQGNTSLIPQRPSNLDFTWETTTKTEIAVELGFFHDRVFVEAAWYNNRSSDQLITYRTPGTAGFSAAISNIDAVIENTGTEIVVNTRNIVSQSFSWTTSFNLTTPRNKLTAFPGLASSLYADLYKVGEPLSVQNLYTYKGVDPRTGNYVILDKDNNQIYDLSDLSFMAPTGRRYYGGLSNTFTYKNFELSLLFQFSKAEVSGFMIHPYPGTLSNQPVSAMNRWKREGDKASEPKFSTDVTNAIQQSLVTRSERNTAMVNFIRLKTASLSYRLPSALTARAGISDARIFVQGQNLLTFTSFDQALDPETINSLPPLRIINAGFQIKL